MSPTIYSELAKHGDHIRCIKGNGNENAFLLRSQKILSYLCNNYLPNGSGFDVAPYVDTDKTDGQRLVIHGEYHVMDENGYYVGWADFTVTVKPHLFLGFTIDVKGRNKGGSLLRKYDLFDHIANAYHYDLGGKMPDMTSTYERL